MAPPIDYYVHPSALVDSGASIGIRTRIWAFAHVLPGAKIGSDCNLCDHVFIENDVVIGDRVTIKCGVQVWDGVRLEDDVFVGPNATFTNDPFPRSRCYRSTYPQTVVCSGASIGANATILPGIVIGAGAMIGAGSVVTKSVPAHAIVKGNPGVVTGYAASTQDSPSVVIDRTSVQGDLPVRGARVIALPIHSDHRGALSVGNIPADVPFTPARFFVVFGVPSRDVRGQHAHVNCHQFLVCISGSVQVMVDDGRNRAVISLDGPGRGLYLPPMIWGEQFGFSADASLLVLASHLYDTADYIRDYRRFLDRVANL